MSPTTWRAGKLHSMLLPGGTTTRGAPSLLHVAISYWKKALRYTKDMPTYAPNIPLLGLPLPTGNVTTKRIQIWKDNGVHDVGDLFEDGCLLSHDPFMTRHGVPNTLFLIHAHILKYVKKKKLGTHGTGTCHE